MIVTHSLSRYRQLMKSILLISDDPDRRAQWQDWLASSRLRVDSVTTLKGMSLREVDCVITDRNLVAELPPEGLNGIGLIVVGAAGFGDVQLAHDSHRSEFRLACRLLAEITVLRRQKKRQTRLAKVYENMAFIDSLTHLANRRGWDKFAESRCKVPNGVLAFFDLDSFKQVNENFGYQRGDEILQIAASTLKELLPADAFLARWGGDEFIAVLSAAEPRCALESIRQRWIAAMSERGARVSATVGWSRFTANSRPQIDEEFGRAERAMRDGKRNGTTVNGVG
jgi:diguanylate cyclase (GGDEF)-like protein